MDPITLSLLMAGGTSLWNYFSQNSQKKDLEDAQKKKLNQYRSSLTDMKYDPFEQSQVLNGVAKVNNSSLEQALNQAALGTSGSMNATQMKGALIAPMVSQNAQRMLEAQNKITDYNKSIDGQIATADLNAPTIPNVDLGQILGDGVGTGLATYQMIDQMNNQKDMLDIEKKRTDSTMNFFKDMDTTDINTFMPWKKKLNFQTPFLYNQPQ